jgi:hypothetical protein
VDNLSRQSSVGIIHARLLIIILKGWNGIGSTKPAVQVRVSTTAGTKGMEFDL